MSQFFFSWVDETATTFGPEHLVVDEEIVTLKIEHTEGNCATASIDIRNPKVGLLAPGRKQWAWLSYDSDVSTGPSAVPIFFGRLTGSPTNLIQEVVTLTFIAKPLDFQDQKVAVAGGMKITPYYDAVFIDPSKLDDPDTVLEGWASLWHIDRTTLAVTASDIIQGEDGTLDFGADEVPYDSLQLNIGQTPETSVQVTGTVHWTQTGSGSVDMGKKGFNTFNGDAIVSEWPKTGQQLSGGWSVQSAFCYDTNGVSGSDTKTVNYSYENRSKEHQNGDTMSVQMSYPVFPGNGNLFYTDILSQSGYIPFSNPGLGSGATTDFTTAADAAMDTWGVQAPIPLHVQYNELFIPFWQIKAGLVLGYQASIKRSETVSFTLSADLQSIVNLPDASESSEIITIDGADVGVAIGTEIPLAPTGNNYFPTDRGLSSVEYLISVARAHLLQRSRCVSLSWDCSFERALDFSCRKNATIHDSRIPGGEATGKITAYVLSGDGDAGAIIGNVTIECAIGHDGSVADAAGGPVYVVSGYVDLGYQVYVNGTISLSNVGYTPPFYEPVAGDIVFPLTRSNITIDEHVTLFNATVNLNTKEGTSFANMPMLSYFLELKSISGTSLATEYNIDVTELKIPKLIDLEAA